MAGSTDRGQVSRSGFEGLILAAGRGSRFRDEDSDRVPKVLRPLLGAPMIEQVIGVLESAGIRDICVVVGHMADEVRKALGTRVSYVVQEEQNGSGGAVLSARDSFDGFTGHLVIMCADSPLFTPATITRMMRRHVKSGAVVTLASAEPENPTGYGRIVRDESGRIVRVAEENDASEQERKLMEVNGGAYVFDARWLFANIHLMRANRAREYNLTDMVRVAAEQARTVAAQKCSAREILGVNTPADLERVERVLRRRLSRIKRQ